MLDKHIPLSRPVSDPSTADVRSAESDENPLRTGDWSTENPDSHQTGEYSGQREQSPSDRSLPQVSGYTVTALLGHGGMGVVYLARQIQLDRVVALKTIRAGPQASETVVNRFLSEARAVARFQHPNIVQIFEIGEYDGLPFFSLEYVADGSLADRIGREPQSPIFAAELVEKLARAMQYAHDRGVVHRDLKPANILIEKDGTPKITDFGLAKSIQDDSGQTQSGQILGTPSFMAPEQARGEIAAVGPPADIYALGAILYDLLTGRPPFSGSSVIETLEMVTKREPVPPSQLVAALPRDLETICLKCLQKGPGARYATAADLADDLRRQLEGRPIQARPVGPIEKARRWCARNPAISAATTFAIVALIAGTAVSVWQAIRAGHEAKRATDAAIYADGQTKEARRLEGIATGLAKDAKVAAEQARLEAEEAQRQTRRAQTVNNFMRDLFFASDPTGLTGVGLLPPGQQGRTITASELLSRGTSQIKDQLKDDPLTRAALLDAIGEVSRTLGLYEASKPLLVEALDIRRRQLPPDHPDLIASIAHLANWHTERGDVPDAERLYLELIEHYRRINQLVTLEAAEVQLRLAVLYVWCLDDAAIPYAKDGLKTRLALLGPKHRDTIVARIALIGSLFLNSKESSDEVTREVAHVTEYYDNSTELEKNGVMSAVMGYQSALILSKLGLNAQAESTLRKASDDLARGWGTNNSYFAIFQEALADVLLTNGKVAEAETVIKQCLETVRATIGLEHPWSIGALASYQAILQKQGRGAEGIRLLDEALKASDKRYGRAFRYRLRLLSLRVEFAFDAKDNKSAAQAVEEFAEEIALRKEKLSHNDQADVWNFTVNMSKADYPGFGNAARKLYEAGRASEARHADLKFRIELLDNYGVFLGKNGNYAEAALHLRELIRIINQPEAKGLIKPREHGIAIQQLGMAEWNLGNFEAAARYLGDSFTYERAGGNEAVQRLMVLAIFLIGRHSEGELLPLISTVNFTKAGTSDIAWLRLVECLSHVSLGDHEKARASLKHIQTLRGDPEDKEVSLSRATVHVGQPNEIVEEIERLRKALSTIPKGKTIPNYLPTNLVYGLLKLGKNDDAAKVLEQFPRLNTILFASMRYLTEFRRDPSEIRRTELLAQLERAEIAIVRLHSSRQFDPDAQNATGAMMLRLFCRDVRNELRLRQLAPPAREKRPRD